MSTFSDYWKLKMHGVSFAKGRDLTKTELMEVQQIISKLQKAGKPSKDIISYLQKENSKLKERWKAERAFWTESKVIETQKIGDAGEELDVSKYKVILSPSACKTCREKTSNGRRTFTSADIHKAGYGFVPPFHPNCYCIIIPHE